MIITQSYDFGRGVPNRTRAISHSARRGAMDEACRGPRPPRAQPPSVPLAFWSRVAVSDENDRRAARLRSGTTGGPEDAAHMPGATDSGHGAMRRVAIALIVPAGFAGPTSQKPNGWRWRGRRRSRRRSDRAGAAVTDSRPVVLQKQTMPKRRRYAHMTRRAGKRLRPWTQRRRFRPGRFPGAPSDGSSPGFLYRLIVR